MQTVIHQITFVMDFPMPITLITLDLYVMNSTMPTYRKK